MIGPRIISESPFARSVDANAINDASGTVIMMKFVEKGVFPALRSKSHVESLPYMPVKEVGERDVSVLLSVTIPNANITREAELDGYADKLPGNIQKL